MAEQTDIPQSATIPERRRPGRVAYANPHLIALLRRTPVGSALPAPNKDNAAAFGPPGRLTDDLGPARGIAIGIVLGAALWAWVICAAALLLQ